MMGLIKLFEKFIILGIALIIFGLLMLDYWIGSMSLGFGIFLIVVSWFYKLYFKF